MPFTKFKLILKDWFQMCQSVREGGLIFPLLLSHVHLQAPFKKIILCV